MIVPEDGKLLNDYNNYKTAFFPEFRKTQLAELERGFKRFSKAFKDFVPSPFGISGDSATGKTSCVSYFYWNFVKSRLEDTTMVSVPCRGLTISTFWIEFLTAFANDIMEERQQQFGMERCPNILTKISPDSVPDNVKLFRDFLRLETRRNRILFFDEFEDLFVRDRDIEGANDLVYILSRTSANIGVIFVMNNPNFLEHLDHKTRNTFREAEIYFPRYTDEQAVQILKLKLERTFTREFMKNPLDIAQAMWMFSKSREENIRLGISTIGTLISRVEGIELLTKDVVLDIMQGEPNQRLLVRYTDIHGTTEDHIFRIIMNLCLHKQIATLDKVYRIYKEEAAPVKSYSTVWGCVDRLLNIGLLKKTTKPGGGQVCYELCHETETLLCVIKKLDNLKGTPFLNVGERKG